MRLSIPRKSFFALGIVAGAAVALAATAALPGSATAQRPGAALGGFANNPGVRLWDALDQRVLRCVIHGEESSKVNWDCTICFPCRCAVSDSSVLGFAVNRDKKAEFSGMTTAVA